MAIPNLNIYELNYSQAGMLLTPPSKRQPVWLAFLETCLSPIQWLRDLIFGDYANGSTAALYNNTTTYSYGTRVVWTDFGIWEQIYVLNGMATNSTGMPPGTVDANGNPYWYKTQASFQGLRMRARINSQKITLEYALNNFFSLYGATFLQPATYGTGTYPDGTASGSSGKPAYDYFGRSSIFIITNQIDIDGFMIGSTEATSSNISQSDGTDFGNNNYIGGNYTLNQQQYNYTIFVPWSVYNALILALSPSDPTDRDSTTIDGLITSYVALYAVYGLKYNVQQY